MTPRAKSNGKWNEGQTKLTEITNNTEKKREQAKPTTKMSNENVTRSISYLQSALN